MNKTQWHVLAWACLLLGIFFICLDSMYWGCVNTISNQLSVSDVWCIVNGEILEPFIYLSYFFWIIFLICAWLEPKRKK